VTPQQLQASGWVDGIGGAIAASEQGTVAPPERAIDYTAMCPFLAAGSQIEVIAD
ncbi:unnamed protein product, partial [Prorocentrum cordatum]